MFYHWESYFVVDKVKWHSYNSYENAHLCDRMHCGLHQNNMSHSQPGKLTAYQAKNINLCNHIHLKSSY